MEESAKKKYCAMLGVEKVPAPVAVMHDNVQDMVEKVGGGHLSVGIMGVIAAVAVPKKVTKAKARKK